jgi:chromosome segregation ATPase
MYKMHSRNVKTPKIKNMKRQKKNELREDFNKHQSETKDTIKREIYKLKVTTQNIKEELNKGMENLRKKESNRNPGNKSPFSQTKHTVEGHSSRLEQVEDKLSELEDKIEIKEKTEEILVKQLRSCERNMQELSDSIKRANLRIMGIEEEVQVKGICTIFHKI